MVVNAHITSDAVRFLDESGGRKSKDIPKTRREAGIWAEEQVGFAAPSHRRRRAQSLNESNLWTTPWNPLKKEEEEEEK